MGRGVLSGGLLFLAICMASGASASSKSSDAVSVARDASFAEQRAKIEADLGDGTTYAEILPQNRDAVRQALDRMQAYLDGVDSVDALRDEARVAVFNDQEIVNTILTQAREDSRMVCRREVGTGTRMKKNDCATVAERRRAREAMQDGWHSIQRGGNIDPAQ